ncbi:TIGR00006: 16S rRNA (cytosine(1402)-N(4))-methyltransferase [Rubrobacter radiotolerans]|uniref:Ribosomal RNA small subunit methyltransferase H n=1 Tax=Rubrobacter radiotolerans TaxID=42256 RepID=A0A023X457_RUBRA|nr:16S rRNA (cytosine(1402)-N(4))-methyltransferase RsmH [Rubrobacter radiotolerans]AHY46790.1 TIGR00006: 16S rRNA (cytosine(1402)-N(4))-methyltransferase [Rubrobacter radiotolerans]
MILTSGGHVPVLLDEAVEALAPEGAQTVVDATFGGGGHTREILKRLPPGGRVFGLDRDPGAAERASDLSGDRRFTFVAGPFDESLGRLLEEGVRADAVLFDLGLSSFQIDDPERGFSYSSDGPLDMRMDPTRGVSAAEWLNSAEPGEVARVLAEYGDVPRGEARRVARAVAQARPLATTGELAEVVRSALGWKERGGNPSKRVFQAVRVFVNDELGSLERALAVTERMLVPGGRLVVITFHSGEDRRVKRFIAGREGRCVCPPELPVCVCGARATLRRGAVIKPSRKEVEANPRSASARLRVAHRTTEPVGEGA